MAIAPPEEPATFPSKVPPLMVALLSTASPPPVEPRLYEIFPLLIITVPLLSLKMPPPLLEA